MATPDFREDVITKIELAPMGRGHWDVVLIRSCGVVLSGTTRYPAESIEQALAITEAWMRDANP
jgi:hypothetical protein